MLPRTDPLKIPARLTAGLDLLREAYRFAEQLQKDPRQFAGEIQDLRRLGLTATDLRWLVATGYAHHRIEKTRSGAKRRSFFTSSSLVLCERSCFALTQQPRPSADRPDSSPSLIPPGPEEDAPPPVVPKWDARLRELRVGMALVKRFRTPARNQELILAVFAEEGWPARIDDPLPPPPDGEPYRRLQNTINKLNRHQEQELIRFHGTGDGRGIRWEPLC